MHNLSLGYFTLCECVSERQRWMLRVLLHKPSVTCQAATETQSARCCSCYCFHTFRVCTDTKHTHANTLSSVRSTLICKIHFKCPQVGGCCYVSVTKMKQFCTNLSLRIFLTESTKINTSLCCNLIKLYKTKLTLEQKGGATVSN